MDDAAPAPWRHDLILDEIAGLCLTMARDLSRAAEDTNNPERKVRLAGALHQMCRSVRQTLALQARLARQMARDDRARARVRKARVRAGVKQLIWTEHEPADSAELEARLEQILAGEPETLALGPIEAHIRRLGALLGLKPTAPTPHPTSSQGSSLGPMPTEPQNDPPTAPIHSEPAVCIGPRDKPEGDVHGGGEVGEWPETPRPTPIPWRSSA